MSSAAGQPDLRHQLARLERARDRALSALAGRELAAADVKEACRLVFEAWELLAAGGEVQQAASFLGGAVSRFGQAERELAALSTDAAGRAAGELREAFARCQAGLLAALTPLLPPPPAEGGGPRVVRTGPAAHELRCSACGAVAARLFLGRSGQAPLERLCYSGVASDFSLDPSEAGLAGALLDEGELRALHQHVRDLGGPVQGIDAWCPECDAAYCFLHWDTREERVAGAYGRTWGTCPSGHRRLLDGE